MRTLPPREVPLGVSVVNVVYVMAKQAGVVLRNQAVFVRLDVGTGSRGSPCKQVSCSGCVPAQPATVERAS